MKPSVETFGDFRSWLGSADRSSGVVSALRLFNESSVSALSKTEYERLKAFTRVASDADLKLFEKWYSDARISIGQEKSPSEKCDVNLSDFSSSPFPLEACMESEKYRASLSYRTNPLSEKDTPELFFRRKFDNLFQLSKKIVLVDRFFGNNFFSVSSGAVTFLREASRLGVNLEIWTSNPDGKQIRYDLITLTKTLKQFLQDSPRNISKVTVYGVGTPRNPLMHDRVGYVEFFKGRVYFELGQGLEILRAKNFERKTFQPASLNIGVTEPSLDRYLKSVSREDSTRVIFSSEEVAMA